MNISVDEQETVIQFNRNEKTMTIYTSDTTTMTRLNKLYPIVKSDVVDGKIVAKTYLAEKRLLSFRKDSNFKPDYLPQRKVSQENINKMLAGRK